MAVAGSSSDGLLRFENLTAALPLIVSCQMDPLCSLETTPPPVQPPKGAKDSEVELWMALVAAASLAVIPIVAMALPLVVFNSFSGRQMDVFVSLGNCLSAGLIFSLGIMHIIPDTVEDLYKVRNICPPSPPSPHTAITVFCVCLSCMIWSWGSTERTADVAKHKKFPILTDAASLCVLVRSFLRPGFRIHSTTCSSSSGSL